MARYLLSSSSTFDATFDDTFQDFTPRVLGSRNGATFQRLGSTFAIRWRRVPIHHRSLLQTASRQRLESMAGRWRTLSGPDQGSWVMQAPNFPRVDSLGNPYTINGPNLQVSANSFLHGADLPLIDEQTGPVVTPSFTIDTVVFVESLPNFQISIDPDSIPANFVLQVYATRYTSPGELVAGQPFRYLGALDPSTTPSLVNWADTYIDFAGSPAGKIGQRIFVMLHMLSRISGQPGVTVSGSGLVVP